LANSATKSLSPNYPGQTFEHSRLLSQEPSEAWLLLENDRSPALLDPTRRSLWLDCPSTRVCYNPDILEVVLSRLAGVMTVDTQDDGSSEAMEGVGPAIGKLTWNQSSPSRTSFTYSCSEQSSLDCWFHYVQRRLKSCHSSSKDRQASTPRLHYMYALVRSVGAPEAP
jgi:hypothetical protein